MSAGLDSTTKSGKWRAVPLAREAFVALDGLSRREWFTGPDDFVFCGPAGDPIDDSALRRRYNAARDAAGLPALPFHHLRHTFATLAIRGLDPATVQTLLGHTKITTTERYLHALPPCATTQRAGRADRRDLRDQARNRAATGELTSRANADIGARLHGHRDQQARESGHLHGRGDRITLEPLSRGREPARSRPGPPVPNWADRRRPLSDGCDRADRGADDLARDHGLGSDAFPA
jgi:hypothetical protein